MVRGSSPLLSFLGLRPPLSNFETARVVVIPVPYEGTVEWHTGTKDAPSAIINASNYLEFYDLELRTETHRLGIHTMGEVKPATGGPARMAGRVYQVVKTVVVRGKLPVVLGGEHSVTYGAVKAVREKHPRLSVLQLDAHTDLRDRYRGSRYGNACIMRRVSEICPVVQVGVRSSSLEEQEYVAKGGSRPVYAWEVDADGDYIDRVLGVLSGEVYVTIDLDVFDPAVMPAVGTPEPGGLSWQAVLALLRRVSLVKRIAGFDVVELCPAEGPASCSYLAASLVYKMIGYALTGGRAYE
ncbi:MAG: agmatinase [Dehalococcoidia bacterium]|nr:agmatinase [Dehalococcoidia bacterium]